MTEGRLRLDIGGNLLDAVLGYLVVFIGLFLLMMVVIAVGKVMVASTKKNKAGEAAPAAAAAPAAPAAAPEIISSRLTLSAVSPGSRITCRIISLSVSLVSLDKSACRSVSVSGLSADSGFSKFPLPFSCCPPGVSAAISGFSGEKSLAETALTDAASISSPAVR